MTTERYEKAVSGLLIIGDRVLLIQRSKGDQSDPGFWETPKGKVEDDEDLDSAIQREFLEETGLGTVIVKKIGEDNWSYTNHARERIHVAETIFQVMFARGVTIDHIQLSDEHDNWQLFSPAEIEELNPMVAPRRELLLSNLKQLFS